MKAEKPPIAESQQLWRRAEGIIPGGSQTFSKGPTQFVDGVCPKFLECGEGCHVWDVDGNRYIDYCMACQPVILGYCDPDVNRAVAEQLEKGITFSLMHPLEVEVAERLIEMVPCAEMVRYGKNGADATSAAVRVARAFTGRDHVAYCGYHGWHDWYIANTDLSAGIPEFNRQIVHAFAYNNLDSLAALFEQYPGQIACVIMEPVTVIEPRPGFVEGVRQLAHDSGALLAFDEIITGFRFAEGGAQEYLGVTPDLACFAKAMSNGMPLSAIVGKSQYMKSLGATTFFSFTYGGECLSLAGAKATLDKIRREKVIDHLWRIGGRLKDGYNALVEQLGLGDFTECFGYACRSVLTFRGADRFDPLEMKSLIQQEMIKRGVLMAGYHALCYSHTDAEIDHTLEAYADALKRLKSIVDRGGTLADHLEGKPVQQVFRRGADFMSYTVRGGEPGKAT